MGVQHVFGGIDEPHLHDLVHREPGELFVRHVPEGIALRTEIFQTDPDGVIQIHHHIGGPVVVNLEPSQLHGAVVDVNPVIRHDVADGFDFG